MLKSKKLKISVISILVIILTGIYVFKMLFPTGPVLDPVPNPISDKTRINKQAEEAQLKPNRLRNLYFGDLHVHTSLSLDAYIGGTLANPDDAYKFARGEAIEIFGKQVKIERPLDFSAVTDHAEAMGEMMTIQNSGEPAHKAFVPRRFRAIHEPDEPIYSVYNPDSPVYIDTSNQLQLFKLALERVGHDDRKHPAFFRGYATTTKAWDIILDAAEKHYHPGKFTTFAGFEWSRFIGRSHLHRNIIFRDMMVPN